jgi:hypothetical protein
MMRPTVAISTAAPDASVRVHVPTLGQLAPADGPSARFRAQLGLPVDRPIIMSGHQAEWWHPGILAKLFAARALADRVGGVVVWVVVDQDDNDPGAFPIPVVRADGSVSVQEHRVAPESHGATGWRPPIADFALPSRASLGAPSVAAGLDRIAAAMRAHRGQRTLAGQIGHASLDTAAPFARADHIVFASDLARTDAWADLVGRMGADPAACVGAYNAPAASLGADHIRVLQTDAARNRWELPMWSIDGAGARTRVWSDSPSMREPASMMPRALAMTALVRLVGCELFIHGLGGWDYDTVTDRWIADWLGRPLAPTGLATASLRLALGGSAPDERDAHAAAAHAHRSRHDPLALGDAQGRAHKDALVARIVADRAAGRSGREGYLALHSFLDGYRLAHAAEIADAGARAASVRDGYRRSRRAITARNWPFPFYEDAALAALARTVASAVESPRALDTPGPSPRSMPR